MFEILTNKLQTVFKQLRGYGRLTEANIQEALREIKLALLDADVNYKVVKLLLQRVQEKAVGQEVLASLSPGQQVVKIVHQELVELLGQSYRKPRLASHPPTIFMLVGLQGSGKTTTAGKLARHYMSEGYRPGLVAADPYRPAAAKQLEVLAQELGIPCYSPLEGESPKDTCLRAVREAELQNFLIIDTAGRLHINQELMEELQGLKKALSPHQIMLVVDAMMGQEAVRVAEGFHNQVGIDGVVLTKQEGDARGGAAISIRAAIGRPIQFIGVGERLDALEPFHPERIASRILGMGDILSLVEKTEAMATEEEARVEQKKLRSGKFTLEDFLAQLRQLKKMGSLEQMLELLPAGLLPGKGKLAQIKGASLDERRLPRMEAIICSMTSAERRNYKIINGSRRLRIARGSGTSVQEVNQLLKNFAGMNKMFKSWPKQARNMGGRFRPFSGIFG